MNNAAVSVPFLVAFISLVPEAAPKTSGKVLLRPLEACNIIGLGMIMGEFTRQVDLHDANDAGCFQISAVVS